MKIKALKDLSLLEMPEERPTVFISPDYRYVCDTCEPLKKGIADGTIEWIGFK